MKVNNGKLIVQEETGIEGVKQKVQDLSQEFESLGLKILVLQKREREEFFLHLDVVKVALKKTQKLYFKLLLMTFFMAASLGALLFWINSYPGVCSSSLLQPATPDEVVE